MADFQRARTEEQRAERAAAFLDAARSLLSEMPLEQVTLNAIAKRAGFAPSNLLRYFDSREALLLRVVEEETENWLTDLFARPPAPARTLTKRQEAVARTLADSFAAHPGFLDLIAIQAAVLELNITTETALAFKRASNAQLRRLADWLLESLPELAEAGDARVTRLAARTSLIAGALWAQSRSSAKLAEELPDGVAPPAQQTFANGLEETLLFLLRGAGP
jgi:AcrR family transcriptional regulator